MARKLSKVQRRVYSKARALLRAHKVRSWPSALKEAARLVGRKRKSRRRRRR